MSTSRKHENGASGKKLDMKYLQAEVSRAVGAAVDARLMGNHQLCNASADMNRVLARYECKCHVRGKETCSSKCICRTTKKICGVECDCHGFCCNSFATLPRLDVRDGALGRELFTLDDLPEQKVAFVVCGHVMTEAHFQRIAQFDSTSNHYAILVFWPGSSMGLPGEPGEVKYVVDPFTHISGKANHSCDPNITVSPYWSNGRVYAVGKTRRRIISKEALTYDYKWTGAENGAVAELCFCRSICCRGLIADPVSEFMEKSIEHYEKEIVRLLDKYAGEEKSLQEQMKALDHERDKGANTEEQELKLVRRQEKNDRLQVTRDRMKTAIIRARKAMTIARNIKARERFGHMRNCKIFCLQKRLPYSSLVPAAAATTSSSAADDKNPWAGWDSTTVREWEKDLVSGQPPEPLPLSFTLAFGKSPPPPYKPPWSPAGSHNKSGVHLFSPHPPPTPDRYAGLPVAVARKVRPHLPMLKPLEPLPLDLTQWPDDGFMTPDERHNVMSWIQGHISGRDESRSVYPQPDSSLTFAYWLHVRLRKPSPHEMETFKIKWSGITTQDLLDRYEEESGKKKPSEKAVRCILSDVLTHIPFRYNSEVKMVEAKSCGNKWAFAWAGQASLPGAIPDFSRDLPRNQRPELTSIPTP